MPNRSKHQEFFLSNLKEEFIAEQVPNNTMKALFRNLFKYVAEAENEKRRDVCKWNEEEMRELLQELAGFRSYSSDNRAKLLKQYISWCKLKQIPNVSDAIFSVEVDASQKIKERLVSDPGHLQRCLNSFLSPEDNLTIDNILRGYCWLAYIGLSEAELITIEETQVNLGNGVVTVSRKIYPFPQEAFTCFKTLKGESFRLYHPGYGDKAGCGNSCTIRDRAQGNKLLRGFRNPEPQIQTLRSMLSTKVKEADVKLSYFRIWLSGEFYRIYQDEQNGDPVSFSYLGEHAMRMREEKKKKPYILESAKGKRTENGKMRELAREYQQDYIRWKEAYYSE